MNREIILLENTVRNSFAALTETHKTHEVQADIYRKHAIIIEWIRIIVTSLTSVGLITILFNQDIFWVNLSTAIVSFISVAITGIMQAFDLKSSESIQIATARKLLRLRDAYTTLLMEIRAEKKDYGCLLKEYEHLEKEKHAVYADAPRTTKKACKVAIKKLQVNKDNQFSESEIDILLPECLRGTNNDINW